MSTEWDDIAGMGMPKDKSSIRIQFARTDTVDAPRGWEVYSYPGLSAGKIVLCIKVTAIETAY
jgi:hypothetical protein